MRNQQPAQTVAATVQYIPLDHLILSDANVRKTFRKDDFDELVASIAAHGLLQNLTVRTEHDLEGNETGRFEVFAGGRRYAALTRLARQKRIARNVPVPCVVREDGVAEELSLVENVIRESLHPADQFEAFKDLNDNKGLGTEEIASRFGVSSRTVKERLRLASVSPELLKLYRQGEMTLDQVMAFTVSDNHARQEEVWDSLNLNRTPETIRRMLLTMHVAADDRRALFVGREAYEAAGGVIFRDLFAEDDGGYFVNPLLLEKLAMAQLESLARDVTAEGWKWVEVGIAFAHAAGWGRVFARDIELADADSARLEQLESELDALEGELESDAPEEQSSQRHSALVAEYEALQAKSRAFDPADIARSGAFICIGQNGQADVVRGLLKKEDQQAAADEGEGDDQHSDTTPDERPRLSDKLTGDLTAHRTAALRAKLGENPAVALTAVVHALALRTFYLGDSGHSCLDISFRSRELESFAPGIGDSIALRAVQTRHEGWAAQLPTDALDLWSYLVALPQEERLALLAHMASLAIDAVMSRAEASRMRDHADDLADAVELDMRDYWTATAVTYFGRVSKPMVAEAVRDAVSPEAVSRIADLKKAAMADEAERLCAGTGWLPELLRPLRAADAEDIAAVEAAE